jgi:serine/threonine protein kinase
VENDTPRDAISLAYTSPEILRNASDFSEKSDVYSFGIIMYELFFERKPFAGLGMVFLIGSNNRPSYDRERYNLEHEREYLQLMEQCWSAEPEHRPSFIEIQEKMKELVLSCH